MAEAPLFCAPSPAKVNLFLEVPARRDDGFHELETIFAELDFADELELRPTRRAGIVEFRCSDPSVPRDGSNLVVRALSRLLEEFDLRIGLEARLSKRIPLGGGLGGGSSNAAVALRLGEAALRRRLDDARRAELALALGSDVPFFLAGGTQLGRGRGELLTPLDAFALDLVLVTPPLHCATAEVFAALRVPDQPRPSEALVQALAAGDLEGVAAGLFNRLEEPAFALWSELAEVKQALLAAGCRGALMSGSGASVFGLCESPEEAAAVAAKLDHARPVRTVIDDSPATPAGS